MSGKLVRVCSPGKVILHGEHAVVYSKKAIAVSVSLFTSLDIRRGNGDCSEDEQVVTLLFPSIDLDLSIKLSQIRSLQRQLGTGFSELNEEDSVPLDSKWLESIQEFIRQHVHSIPTPGSPHAAGQIKATEAFIGLFAAIVEGDLVEPLVFEIKTELPVGAGLGSSASFGAALVAGILRWTGKISADLNKEDRLMINRWTFFSEKFVHGSPSGIDNHVATYGGAVVFQRQRSADDNDGEAAQVIPCPEIRVILVDTKVSRSTHQVVQKVKELKDRSLETWEKIINDIGQLVENAVEEIRDNKSMKSQLFLDNHRLLQQLGVSHPALDQIVDIGKSLGFDGKLTGAGGGGCAFLFIPPDADEDQVTTLKNSLTSNGFQLWETKLGCPGVHFRE